MRGQQREYFITHFVPPLAGGHCRYTEDEIMDKSVGMHDSTNRNLLGYIQCWVTGFIHSPSLTFPILALSLTLAQRDFLGEILVNTPQPSQYAAPRNLLDSNCLISNILWVSVETLHLYTELTQISREVSNLTLVLFYFQYSFTIKVSVLQDVCAIKT